MPIKAIIFDADGVLVNKPKVFSECLEEDYGIKRSITSKFFKGDFQNCLVGKADLKKELEKYIKEWEWESSVDDLLKYWFKVEHHTDQRIVQLVKRLNKKIPCFMAVNQEAYRTEYMKSEMEFSKLFKEVFSSAYVGHKKPYTEFFEHVFKKIGQDLQIKKQEVLFVDDDLENIEAAKSFGFQTLLYKDFPDFENLITQLL